MRAVGQIRPERNLIIYFQREAYLLDSHSGVKITYESSVTRADDNPLISPDGRWQLVGTRNAAAGETALTLLDHQQNTETRLGAYSVIPLNPLGVTWLDDATVWVLALEFNTPRTDTLLLQYDVHTASLIKEYRFSRLSPLSWMPSPNSDYMMLMGQQRVFPYQQTFVIDLKTGEDTLGGIDIFSPRWSPDGNWLYYEMEVNGQQLARWVNFVTERTLEVPKDGVLRTLSVGWSPDSQWTVYESFINDVYGVSMMNLATGQHHVILETSNELLMRWSPQGNRLLIMEQADESTRIWITQDDHTNPFLIDTVLDNVASARWSNDETRLAYHIRNDDKSIVRVYDLLTATRRDVLHSERIFRIEWLENNN